MGLVGCWVVSAALLGIYLAAESDDRLGVLMFVALPLFVASVAPYVVDAWRNPTLSTAAATAWAWLTMYLPFIGATAYWLRHAPRAGGPIGPTRPEPRVSPCFQDRALGAWMLWVVIVGSALVVYVVLAATGVVE